MKNTKPVLPNSGEAIPNVIEYLGGKGSIKYKDFARDLFLYRENHWLSMFYQCQPIVELEDVRSVLEFGGGRDLTKSICRYYGINHETVDVSDVFFPDYISSISEFPNSELKYDLVCSFQCLEHNKFEELSDLVPKMLQHSRKYLYISIPYNGAWFSLFMNIRFPKVNFKINKVLTLCGFGARKTDLEKYNKYPPEKKYDPHWWEAGRPGFSKIKLIRYFEKFGLKIINSKHNPAYPHHWFLLF